jgi:hypothetical protein
MDGHRQNVCRFDSYSRLRSAIASTKSPPSSLGAGCCFKDSMDAETLELLKSMTEAHPEMSELLGNDNPQTSTAWDFSDYEKA